MNSDSDLATWVRTTHHRYKDIRTLILTGSRAHGKARKDSDVDLIIIFDHLANARKECFRSENFLYDVQMHDPETLAFLLNAERRCGPISLTTMLLNCRVLRDDLLLAPKYVEFAKSTLHNGPTDPNWPLLRYQLQELCYTLENSVSEEQKLVAEARLFEHIIIVALFRIKRFPSNRVEDIQMLKTTSPEFTEKLLISFKNVLSSEWNQLSALGWKVLAQCGGPVVDGLSFSYPSNFRLNGSSTIQHQT